VLSSRLVLDRFGHDQSDRSGLSLPRTIRFLCKPTFRFGTEEVLRAGGKDRVTFNSVSLQSMR
jgi:hypothetical protein